MRSPVGFIFVFLAGAIIGFIASIADSSRLSLLVLAVGFGFVVFMMLLQSRRNRDVPPTYDEVAIELYEDISRDVKDIRQYMERIKQWQLRQQLELICDDIMILLEKVAEKSPESRLTTGKFIRGYLDFITNDILPQYVEMQDTPRYFESTQDKMADGQQAIRTFGTFLHRRIVQLEIADDIRYAIAIDMIAALTAYNTNETENIKERGQ